MKSLCLFFLEIGTTPKTDEKPKIGKSAGEKKVVLHAVHFFFFLKKKKKFIKSEQLEIGNPQIRAPTGAHNTLQP